MSKKNCLDIENKKEARISVRVSSDVKQDVEIVLNKLGMSTSEAINIYLSKILSEGGIPFDLKLPKSTLDAINDAKKGKNLTKHTSSQNLFNKLRI